MSVSDVLTSFCSSGWRFTQPDRHRKAQAVSSPVAQIGSRVNDAFQRRHVPGKFSFSAQLKPSLACYSSTKRMLTPQVNFYHDHTKIILCSQSEEYLLTYINEDRVSTTLRLSTLLVSGCSADLRSRMDYALNMLLQRCN